MGLAGSRLRPSGQATRLITTVHTTITRRQHSSNANPFKCPHCTQAFKSEKRLKMHVEPTHYSPTRLTCPLCASTAGFERPWKLAQHMRDKHAARAAALEAVYSPLDRFFRAHESDNSRDHMRLVYVDADLPDHLWVKCWDVVEGDIYNDKRVLAMPKHFHYEPLLPPWVSFALLRKARRWADGWESMKKAHADYGAALVGELRLAFGNHVGELESWRKLCKAVGVPQKRLPADVDRCRELLHGKHINLVDLASWARWRGDEVQGKTVAAFESASALHRYARITWKAFPREYLETVKLNDSRGRSEVVPYLLGTMLDRCRKDPAFGLYSGPPLREDERMERLKRAIEKWEREMGPINAEGPISLKMFGQKKPRHDLLQDLSVEDILVI